MFFEVTHNENKTFEKTRFLTMDYGVHIVRFLGAPIRTYAHYLRTKSLMVKCLEEDCPICKVNSQIRAERPDDFFTNPGYFAKSERHYINVLDRTLVKICPNCQAENTMDISKKFSPTCVSCESFLTDVKPTPSEKVKVLNLSKTLADVVNGFATSVCNAEGEPLDIHTYDIAIMVTKSGQKKNITAYPIPENHDVVEVPEESYYDLEKALIVLTEDELVNLMKGVSLKDIYVARRAGSSELEESLTEASADLDDKIKKLFG